MSITHLFSRNVTYKKHKKRKMFSPHRNHDIPKLPKPYASLTSSFHKLKLPFTLHIVALFDKLVM